MNNFDMNWMFHLPNLFGMGGFNGNCNQNAAQPSADFQYEENMAASNPDSLCQCGSEKGAEVMPGPMGPRGEPGERGPAGPPGYPQNSIFASFLSQELVMPEIASLPLKVEIPDITQNISLCDKNTIALSPGYYAISYYIATEMKKHGFIKLTPILNDDRQTIYTAYAEAANRKEMLVIARYFIIEIPVRSTLFFAWRSSACDSQINMNLSIEKLCRQ